MAQLTVIRAEQDEPQDGVVGQTIHFLEEEMDSVVSLRNDEKDRDLFSDDDEAALWRIKSKLEFVLLSLKIDRETIDLRQVAAE